MHPLIIKNVTGLYSVRSAALARPESLEALCNIISQSPVRVSTGGGRFSMGGQIGIEDGLHIDMRSMNQILAFDPVQKTILVQAGIRWCDIQRFIDPHNLSIKIMQTYANFTVGGSLSVNCHGRYMGQGAVVHSVLKIQCVLADGTVVWAKNDPNDDFYDLFCATIGGYGMCSIISAVQLQLVDNCKIKRLHQSMPLRDYLAYFKQQIRQNKEIVFHNADIYPTQFNWVRAVSWQNTDEPTSIPERLQPLAKRYDLHQYFIWRFTQNRFGAAQRKYLVDPLLYLTKPVVCRNYEAGYDCAELEPLSRSKQTYVLQEYFIPIDALESMVAKLAVIFKRYRVKVLNISIRHAKPDTTSYLSWSPTETFALVVYYRQGTQPKDQRYTGMWTRECIEAALAHGGRYYLPYQPHATYDQFTRAYEQSDLFFQTKEKYDPQGRLSNQVFEPYWHQYLGAQNQLAQQTNQQLNTRKQPQETNTGSQFFDHKKAQLVLRPNEFQLVFNDTKMASHFYLFLQNIFTILPDQAYFELINEAQKKYQDAHEIYTYIQTHLKTITNPLAQAKASLMALGLQKQIIGQQMKLFCDAFAHQIPKLSTLGYVEIGSKGRYSHGAQQALDFGGPLYFIDHPQTSKAPIDFIEHQQLSFNAMKLTHWQLPTDNQISPESCALATMVIGLHHTPEDKLVPMLTQIYRYLAPNGLFIIREHHVHSAKTYLMASLAHTTFNAGLMNSLEENQQELRFFNCIEHWDQLLASVGFVRVGDPLYQEFDPTDNALLCYQKKERTL